QTQQERSVYADTGQQLPRRHQTATPPTQWFDAAMATTKGNGYHCPSGVQRIECFLVGYDTASPPHLRLSFQSAGRQHQDTGTTDTYRTQ
ncbi:hypothetical protein, partial [Enterococcus faecium]|uniref:hypothetical protein n=1 Tax=Enterococcus faecium TaxID=1352 RepID=UPI003AAA88F3